MKEYVYRYRIALSDTDAGGIVYHSNYISIAERARMEMLREAGVEGKILDAEEGKKHGGTDAVTAEPERLPKPKEIYDTLSEYVIGQDEAPFLVFLLNIFQKN